MLADNGFGFWQSQEGHLTKSGVCWRYTIWAIHLIYKNKYVRSKTEEVIVKVYNYCFCDILLFKSIQGEGENLKMTKF